MIDANLISIVFVTFVFAGLILLRRILFPTHKHNSKKILSPGIEALPWVLISPSEGILPDHGQTYSIFTTADLNPETSVRSQSKQPATVILWVGFTKKRGFSGFKEMINEARKYPNIRYVFVYEEMFWEPPGRLALGEREKEILHASNYAKANGLEPVVILTPDIILNPDFELRRINTYGVIAISDHPSVNPTIRLNDAVVKCKFSSNLTTNLLYLSVQKIRYLGFNGELWYAYQAFGLTDVASDVLIQDFKAQCETLETARTIGIDAVVPYGLYLGNSEISRKPTLFQGKGTVYETLLRPPIVN